MNVSPVDDFGAGLKKSHHWPLVLGKMEQEIASLVGNNLAWIILSHRALAFDPPPSDDGASSSKSGKKSKKSKKKEAQKEAKKTKKAKSSDRDDAEDSQPPALELELKVTNHDVGDDELILCEMGTVSTTAGHAPEEDLVEDPAEDPELTWEWDMFDLDMDAEQEEGWVLTPILTINDNDSDDDLEVIGEEPADMTKDLEEGGGNANMEDSLEEDLHDFEFSGRDPDCEHTLFASKGLKSSTSGKVSALKGPVALGDANLEAARNSAATWAVSQLGTALKAITKSRTGSIDSGFNKSEEHPS